MNDTLSIIDTVGKFAEANYILIGLGLYAFFVTVFVAFGRFSKECDDCITRSIEEQGREHRRTHNETIEGKI